MIAADKDRGYNTGSYANKRMSRGLTSRPFNRALAGASTRKPTTSKVRFRDTNEVRTGHVIAFDVLAGQLMVAVGRIAKSLWVVPAADVIEVTYSPLAEGEQFFDYMPYEGRVVRATDWE